MFDRHAFKFYTLSDSQFCHVLVPAPENQQAVLNHKPVAGASAPSLTPSAYRAFPDKQEGSILNIDMSDQVPAATINITPQALPWRQKLLQFEQETFKAHFGSTC